MIWILPGYTQYFLGWPSTNISMNIFNFFRWWRACLVPWTINHSDVAWWKKKKEKKKDTTQDTTSWILCFFSSFQVRWDALYDECCLVKLQFLRSEMTFQFKCSSALWLLLSMSSSPNNKTSHLSKLFKTNHVSVLSGAWVIFQCQMMWQKQLVLVLNTFKLLCETTMYQVVFNSSSVKGYLHLILLALGIWP